MGKTKTSDRCVGCRSDNLFSGFFDADDLAVIVTVENPAPGRVPGTRWTTFCNECGTEQP